MDPELSRHFFERGIEASYVMDRETQRVVEANQKFLELTGYSREDFLSGRITSAQLVDPEFHPFLRRKISERLTLQEDRYSIRIRRKSGEPLDLDISVWVVPHAEGTRVCGIARPQKAEWFVPTGSLEPGTKIGQYQIISESGRGGFAVVYRARDLSLDRIVALKVLIPGAGAEPTSVERLRREARALARMGKHPNIVQIHDAGDQGAIHFIAMDFVNGPTLASLIEAATSGDAAPHERTRLATAANNRPILGEPRTVAAIAAKIADALAHAHRHGIIHRDMKPANVLLDERGEPQVTDFGLARLLTQDVNSTLSAGAILGTPAYMAPEQLTGRSEDVDARTDVHSLGATLYHLLVGVPPFQGNSIVEVLLKVQRGSYRRARDVRPDVPGWLDSICGRAMSLDPAQRFQSMEEFAVALRFEETYENGPATP